jgi:hypothetical protein
MVMIESPRPGSDNFDFAAQKVLGQFDAPAYVRRARQLENAIEQVLETCRRKREDWLEMVRLRLGVLRGLAEKWAHLTAILADPRQIQVLEQLESALQPRLRIPIEPTTSARRLRNALQELSQSIARFNRRWAAHLSDVDLSHVNMLIDGYNRYYVLEKECVVRSASVARLGFRPRPLLTLDWLIEELPMLALPTLRS